MMLWYIGGDGEPYPLLAAPTIVANVQVMATGGNSYPKLGTDGGGWRVLRGLGHKLRDPYPALTPLKGAHPSGAQLSGGSGTCAACYEEVHEHCIPQAQQPSSRTARVVCVHISPANRNLVNLLLQHAQGQQQGLLSPSPDSKEAAWHVQAGSACRQTSQPGS